ncbi:MAG: hypothetical protein JO146_07555 [Candidatus Eremiobacteraeota bacterium]|nr:hypothetical protein [Candidatus Eremiobacteraeota bacterium]
MFSHSKHAALALVAVLVAACSNSGAVPMTQSVQPAGLSQPGAAPAGPLADHTSILNKFKKDVVIGSTVDPTNGDTGPHSISIVQSNYGLKKGQLVVCNFADSSGNAGKGTTIEVLDPKPGSKPTSFAQSSQIEGCDGAATTYGNGVCAAGLTSGLVACFGPSGTIGQSYGSPLAAPFDDADAHCIPGQKGFCGYSAEYIFASDAKTGGIVNWSINQYGNPNETQVVGGFAENKKSGWSALGPSGLSYNSKLDEMYIADGVNNTVVGITHAGSLLVKDEVVVLKGGKTFKCKYHGKADPCGQLILAGSPLNAPEAMTVLPNGNLVVANTAGGNTLVEIDVSTGKVLATKTVDTGASPAIFALRAAGKNDTSTVLYYTDTNDNSLHELEQ